MRQKLADHAIILTKGSNMSSYPNKILKKLQTFMNDKLWKHCYYIVDRSINHSSLPNYLGGSILTSISILLYWTPFHSNTGSPCLFNTTCRFPWMLNKWYLCQSRMGKLCSYVSSTPLHTLSLFVSSGCQFNRPTLMFIIRQMSQNTRSWLSDWNVSNNLEAVDLNCNYNTWCGPISFRLGGQN